jgi:CSLREA domain-containing protein
MKLRQYDPAAKRHLRLRYLRLALAMLLAVSLLGFIRWQSSVSAQDVSNPFVSPAFGVLFTVNSTADTPDAVVGNGLCADSSGRCTLRAAIQEANANSTDDTINFNIPTTDPGYDGFTWTINLNSALPNLSTNVTINGPGPVKDNLTLKRNSSAQFRIFSVTAAAHVGISTLTIMNGLAAGNGGGLSNAGTGTVSITNCAVDESSASGLGSAGGGTSNDSTGTITITDTFVNDNSAYVGGGLSNSNSGTVNVFASSFGNNGAENGGGINNGNGILNVVGCIVHSNRADMGAGIDNEFSGTLNVTNSTISGNVVTSNSNPGYAGGILNTSNGTVNVSNSTISGNDAEGLYNSGSGPFNVKSSIVHE